MLGWYAGGLRPAAPSTITAASAVEILHVGTLYHDDVMDGAALRRTVPSALARFGADGALDYGCALLGRACAAAAGLGSDHARVMAGALNEVCIGQALEMRHEHDPERPIEGYFTSIEGKTAALLAASLRLGAMTADLHPDAIETLAEAGRELGLVFQIVDDLLDLLDDATALGKPAGNDIKCGVFTLPVLLAAESSPDIRDELRALRWETDRPPCAESIRRSVHASDGPDRALSVAETLAAAATERVQDLAIDPAAAHAFLQLIESILAGTQTIVRDRHRDPL